MAYFLGDWQSLQHKYVKNKLPVEMVDTIEMDDKQLKVVFKKTDPSDSPVLFKIKMSGYMHCSLSEVKVNQIINSGIMPEKLSAIDLQPCE